MPNNPISCGLVSLALRATGVDLSVELSLDGKVFYQGPAPLETQVFSTEFNDEQETDHILRITLSGKLPTHTKIDAEGNFIEDRALIISDVKLEDMKLGHIFVDQAIYEHDFNGGSPLAQYKFYGEMGCNGTVSFKFASPVYVWLLEHL